MRSNCRFRDREHPQCFGGSWNDRWVYHSVCRLRALYEFLPPAAAFLLLGAVALATLAAALLHGLALTALIFGALWSLPGLDLFLLTVTAALGAHVFHVLAGFALAATFLVANLLYGPRTAPSQMDRLSNLALSIYLVVATLLVLASRHDPAALIAFVVLTAATVGIAWRTEAATPSVVVATRP